MAIMYVCLANVTVLYCENIQSNLKASTVVDDIKYRCTVDPQLSEHLCSSKVFR